VKSKELLRRTQTAHSGNPENAYFTEGIQEEILTRLANIADLKVISRTSTQHFKSSPDNLPQIAQRLGVANILEGSVQRAADQVPLCAPRRSARHGSTLPLYA
jgi:TolB-like protein